MIDADVLAEKLRDILTTYLADPTSKSDDAALQLTSSIGCPEDDDEFCWILWAEVCSAVKSYVNNSVVKPDAEIAHLVALVAAIKVQPAPHDDAAGGPRIDQGRILWKDLPNLGPQMREMWNGKRACSERRARCLTTTFRRRNFAILGMPEYVRCDADREGYLGLCSLRSMGDASGS